MNKKRFTKQCISMGIVVRIKQLSRVRTTTWNIIIKPKLSKTTN